MPHVTIVGGGIAGLATAFYLQKKSAEAGLPLDYTLVEREPRFGGKIDTAYEDEFIIEGGPDSFVTIKPHGTMLCRDLGLQDEIIPTNDDRRNIFVLKNGKLTPFPGGYRLTIPTEFVPFALSTLISPLGKLRMGLDLFIPPRRETGDESLAGFIRRRLGSEALDRIAGPIMAGIYVADPEKLSMQSTFPDFLRMEQQHGSLIKAMRQAKKQRAKAAATAPPPGSNGSRPPKPPAMFTSLRGGMKHLVDTLIGQLDGDLRPGSTVTGLGRQEPGFRVTVDGPDGEESITTDAVVIATPAYVAARLVETFAPELAEQLRQIRYVSTATVSLGYRAADVAGQHNFDGFGFMIPKSENRQILACTWSSTKFNHRAPGGDALVRVFVGGDGREHLLDLPDDELVALARAELADIMELSAAPVVSRVFRWPKGNAQYDVGHLDRVAGIEAMAAAVPGLYFTGSAFRGIGIPDCVKSAIATVDQLLEQVPVGI
ncbi:MAG: protoporphyrinogen oxidase [Anaerolineae bacterium]